MYLDRATLRRMAGEVIVCGFAAPQVDATLKEIHREVLPLGLIVFDRNVEEAAQALELNRELKSLHAAWLVAIDQEGGSVARLRDGVTAWPPLAHVGRAHDAKVAAQMGHGIASELRALGYDINFAPVVDVHTNADNPIIGARAFSSDPRICGEFGAAFVRGHQSAGVAASAKHFPGHGDTSLDSHHALPHVAHDMERLEHIEWPPFRAVIEAQVSSIMTAHVCLDVIDDRLPATVSETILQNILRERLQFGGIIVADDIDMGGLSQVVGPTEAGEKALLAGCDVLLACHNEASTMQLYEGIVRAAESKRLPHDVLAHRANRAVRWREQWQRPVLPVKVAHQQLQAALQRNATWLAALEKSL